LLTRTEQREIPVPRALNVRNTPDRGFCEGPDSPGEETEVRETVSSRRVFAHQVERIGCRFSWRDSEKRLRLPSRKLQRRTDFSAARDDEFHAHTQMHAHTPMHAHTRARTQKVDPSGAPDTMRSTNRIAARDRIVQELHTRPDFAPMAKRGQRGFAERSVASVALRKKPRR